MKNDVITTMKHLIVIVVVVRETVGRGDTSEVLSMKKTVKVPIKLVNGLPYFEINSLCSAKAEQYVTTKQAVSPQSEWFNEQDSEFEQLGSFHQQSDLSVLLDTGSVEFWLADSKCSNCPYSRSLCPHLSAPNHKVSYVRGYVDGVYSYINLCGNRMKFLCAKAVEGIGRLSGEGIVGLKDGGLGLEMVFQMLKKKNGKKTEVIQKTEVIDKKEVIDKREGKENRGLGGYQMVERRQITFTYGKYLNEVQLSIQKSKQNHVKPPKSPNITSPIVLTTNINWSIPIKSISLFNSTINISETQFDISQQNKKSRKMYGFVDTGASKIVLSHNLCKEMVELMHRKEGMLCRYRDGSGIDCDRMIDSLNMRILVEVGNGEKENAFSEILIKDQFIIDPASNRLNIICHSSAVQQAAQQQSIQQQSIILGCPLFQTYQTTFIIEKHRLINMSQNIYKIHLQPIQQSTLPSEQLMVGVMMGLYGLSVGLVSWVIVYAMDFVRDKRSKKIII